MRKPMAGLGGKIDTEGFEKIPYPSVKEATKTEEKGGRSESLCMREQVTGTDGKWDTEGFEKSPYPSVKEIKKTEEWRKRKNPSVCANWPAQIR